MSDLEIFTISGIYLRFTNQAKKVRDHEKRTRFDYEGQYYSVYDHQARSWRHLDFFEHECYLHARVPRVRTDTGQVKLVSVPWAKPAFTLLFESKVRSLILG